MANSNLSVEQVTRYLTLVDRRMYILMHSGVDWKPEYEKEFKDIDREISVFRELIDAVHASKDAKKGVHCCVTESF